MVSAKTYSTTYALIHLTESTKEALDQGKYGCEIFVNLQESSDTVDHSIILGKLKHYGIRVVPYSTIMWRRGVEVIATARLHPTTPELRFLEGSNPARSMSKICHGKDL